MKRPIALLLCLLMMTVSLAGCFGGDDDESPETPEPIPALDDWDVYYVASGADLPNCNSETLGRLYYVEADAGFQTCTSTGWSFIDLTGPAGADGADGSTGASGVDGADGTNGVDGADGADGTNGVDGADGADGTNGADGADGANGTDGADGTNGTGGANGSNGHYALAVTSSEPSGPNCADGGIKIEVGVDDNDDNALQTTEIDQTTYICNGADGPNGTDGADGAGGAPGANGADGADGTNGSASPNTMLTSISPPASSLGCTAGGRAIAQGLDNGDGGGTSQNGVLESGEIDYTTTYCSIYEVWQVDKINKHGNTYPGEYMEFLIGDTLYFDALYGPSYDKELWAHDTSNHTTWQVTDINSGGNSSNPGQYMSILVGDTIYFSADDGSSGTELWAHDTSNSSTWQVADINIGGNSSNPGLSGGFGSMGVFWQITGWGAQRIIYFSADDGSSGTELWAHNAINFSTWQVTDINSGGNSSNPGQYMAILVDDTIYFSADDGGSGTELWAHDISNSSTWQVADINSGGNSSNPGQYMTILVGDTIYFNAFDVSSGREMWAHDTSNSSTWQVANINIGSNYSNPGLDMIILVGDTIYFDATDGVTGQELWAHDTSNHSTWQVADIRSGSGTCGCPGKYMEPILVGDTIYFDADDNGVHRELWAHDTSNSSTWLVTNYIGGYGGADPGSKMAILVGDTIYFDANDNGNWFENGTELWAHDTSNSSTWRVTQINPGSGNSNPGRHMAILVGDTIYFDAYTQTGGYQLWAMDIEHSITYD